MRLICNIDWFEYMRLALGIEYDGAAYHGWQRQHEVLGVQEQVEKALSRIAAHPVQVVCAGRTDAGVHATEQVVHFDTDSKRVERAWTIGANGFLPASIAVKWVKEVDDNFHARFSATSRRYRYIIYNHPQRCAILQQGVTHVYKPLDVEPMQLAACSLIGEHDFTTFRASLCQAKTATRRISQLQVSRQGNYIIIDVQANAFLHHMVRNIAGTLIEIGALEKPVEWMEEVLRMQDRTKAAATAKPNGLYLVKVFYPETFQLPTTALGPLFLAD
jgi:tRNA pseudouridine38-40 synthase